MSTVILYKTKYGSTRQYAEWAAEDLHADVFPIDGFDVQKFAAYDSVVLGGYLHIGKIVGADFLNSNWPLIQDKRVVLFSVGGTPRDKPERETWFEESVPADIRSRVTHVPLRGRTVNLDFIDRLLVSFPKTQLRLRYWMHPSVENKAALDQMAPRTELERGSIAPLIAALKK